MAGVVAVFYKSLKFKTIRCKTIYDIVFIVQVTTSIHLTSTW